MNGLLKPSLAEMIGTFTLIFIGAGAGALASANGGGIVGVALAHGLAITIIVYTWGPISGAHVNPAVTLGVLVAGKIDIVKAIAYWVAQFLGAVVAAFLLNYLLLGIADGLGETKGVLTDQGESGKVILVEAVLTFFLVAAVFGSAVTGRNGNAYGLAIGFVLVGDILCGGYLTGASMNPARTFGPALVKNDLSYFWLYVVGPAAGAIVAAVLFKAFYMDDEE